MKSRHTLLVALAAGVLGACDTTDPESEIEATTEKVLNDYAALVYANYQDAVTTAETLDQKIDELVANPSASTLKAAKDAWLASREPYGQSEVFRFYNGPIDGKDGDPEGLINSWPLDESYIDYVDGNSGGGIANNIIADADTELTKAKLMELNGGDGSEDQEARVATGYHAIEFLLWGQDLTDGPEAGQRPFTDYSTGDHAARRGQYLQLVSELLLDNLKEVRDQWAAGGNNYRTGFVGNAGASLAHLFNSMGKLSKGELGGERVQKALTERDKEEEHSCFSDNTHRDIVTNAKGIENVFFGRYTPVTGAVIDGMGIDDLIKLKDKDLAAKLTAQLAATKTAVEALKQFDQEIRPDGEGGAGGDARVQAVVKALSDQADLIVEAAALFSITVDPADI